MTPPDLPYNLLFIPLFPLLGAVFNLVFGRFMMRSLGDRLGREAVHLVAIGVVAFSCFFTINAVSTMSAKGADRLVHAVYPWIVSGETNIGFELLLDHLSGVMCLVITGVGLLIHIFSVGYMAKDPDYHRYFAYLNLFMAAMLILVLGKSLVLTFVGWEGVGLCSYLLIGFWYTDEEKASAGKKAFIMNRIGDFGFILGMLLIYSVVQSLDVDAIRQMCATGDLSPFTKTVFHVSTPFVNLNFTVGVLATLCLFIGCCGKSAQIPLFTWLPDAMAGPTPVSALIHAATMVTAGIYLIVRLNFLFALAPLTMAVIAVVGATTALMAATIGITQNDIKKVLAYSTVSQLGFMFIAAGLGAWTAAIFHLVTHAFFKACLFLGSGAVIEACHHNQDIRTMGGLKEKMPVTRATFLVSCLAIAGIFPFSGFFSKDEILLHGYINGSEWSPGVNYYVYIAGAIAAFCTAFYMFRLYCLTFEGKFRGDHHTWKHHVKEYWIMSMPLVLLAIAATFGGFLGWPHALHGIVPIPHVLEEWLEPALSTSLSFGNETPVNMANLMYRIAPRAETMHDGHVSMAIELGIMGVSLAIAIAGSLWAWNLYKDGPSERAAEIAGRLGVLYRASKAKYWVDEIYDALIVKPVKFLGFLCYQVGDQLLVDTVGVGGVSGTVKVVGERVRLWHNGNVRRYLAILLLGVVLVLASVFANPRVVQVGPSVLNARDPGGLRPTLGEQNVSVKLFGLFELPWFRDEVPAAGGATAEPPDPGQRLPGIAEPPSPLAPPLPSAAPERPQGGAR
jgi:NADH-quinone oxidoreductase subunit L